MLKRYTFAVGPFQCNCTVLVDDVSKEAIVIDAGDEFPRIKALCEKHGAKVTLSIHTHAHLDHIGAVAELKQWSPSTQIALHKKDERIYRALPMQGQMFGLNFDVPPPVGRFVVDEEVLTVGKHSFSVMHTPGHSAGGICLHFGAGAIEKEPVVFSGDTLFQQSIGRTDLWDGDYNQLISSIKNRLLTLDEQTRVYPGHGPATVIGIEARENPFL